MLTVDAHVHTCLSPCAELDMHPAGVVDAARLAGLDALAICDHNAADNVAATQRAGRSFGIGVIAGMEITSAEEVHVLALLPGAEAALTLQSRVNRELPGRNDPDAFGWQVIANEHAEVLGFSERLLSGATGWTVERVVDEIHRTDGLAVAAHVDRERFGIIGQLGMIPGGLSLDALEVSPNTTLAAARERFAPAGEFALLCSSDAHHAGELGRAVTFMLLGGCGFDEVALAVAGRDGRAVLGGGRPMEDLALHILDIAQNAVEACASRVAIELLEDEAAGLLRIEIRDDGRGMTREQVERATDPFFTTRTTRRVGMGLALLSAAARAAGGEVAIESRPGEGTRVTAAFRLDHVDLAPIGDLETTLLVLLAGNPGLDLSFAHSRGGRSYELRSAELRAALEGESLSSPAGIAVLRAAIRRGEASLRGPESDRGVGGRA